MTRLSQEVLYIIPSENWSYTDKATCGIVYVSLVIMDLELTYGLRAVAWRGAGTDCLFVGGGAGVWWSVDEGVTWSKDGDDLPNVNVGDLLWDAEEARLYVATYGRGMWAATISDLFSDDFEGGSLGAWAAAVGGAP